MPTTYVDMSGTSPPPIGQYGDTYLRWKHIQVQRDLSTFKKRYLAGFFFNMDAVCGYYFWSKSTYLVHIQHIKEPAGKKQYDQVQIVYIYNLYVYRAVGAIEHAFSLLRGGGV